MRVEFLIVGGVKCATTSIHHYLDQHPDLCLAEGKETNYFLDREPLRMGSLDGLSPIAKNLSEYHDRFLHPDRLCGEVCPSYLQFNTQRTIVRIKHHNPEMKIVMVLRDPIDRLLSAYRHLKTYKRIPDNLSLEEIIFNEKQFSNYAPIYKLKSSSLYYEAFCIYKFWFGDRVKVYQYEQFIQHPQAIVSDIFKFLGVKDTIVNTSFQWNVNLSELPYLESGVRMGLERYFENDIRSLVKARLIDPSLWSTYQY